MQRQKTFVEALAALMAGIIVSRAGTKLSIVKGKTPKPLGENDLLDGMPSFLYDLDPDVPVRVLPQIQQDRNSTVGPWAPMAADLLASDWNIHTLDPEPAPAAGVPSDSTETAPSDPGTETKETAPESPPPSDA